MKLFNFPTFEEMGESRFDMLALFVYFIQVVPHSGLFLAEMAWK